MSHFFIYCRWILTLYHLPDHIELPLSIELVCEPIYCITSHRYKVVTAIFIYCFHFVVKSKVSFLQYKASFRYTFSDFALKIYVSGNIKLQIVLGL